LIRYQLNTLLDESPITISLPVTDGDSVAALLFEGSTPERIEMLKASLNRQYGAFGHGFNVNSTTAYDLDIALKSPDLSPLQAKIVEGWAIVEEYDPEIPEGAVT
jgi:hypothetical protein